MFLKEISKTRVGASWAGTETGPPLFKSLPVADGN
jgi:hypothetical protein